MIFIESDQTDPYFNLALEEYVFENMDQNNEYMMFWQNDNTIVVGKYQNTAEEINHQYVKEQNIRVVRRLSGGGAVYHDKGNLNFTFIVTKEPEDDSFDFKKFIIPVIESLEKLGVHAQFNGRNDITINGQKISGNSQYGRHGRWLHHGCIMLDSNLQNVADALNVRAAKFESKSIKSVRSRVTTINAHAPHTISMEQFKSVLRECVHQKKDLTTYTLSQSDLDFVHKLRDNKYATWEWNYGASPSFNMRREMKFPSGLVTAFLQSEAGKIKSIRLYGDFFGNGDLAELENAMVGLPLDTNLEHQLQKTNIGYYMNGFTAADLSLLLT